MKLQSYYNNFALHFNSITASKSVRH